ncbi:DUF1015 family protein [Rhodopirellula sallentina]|uniref:Uncharacterized protein n=1 Tax=Rhodopirellula sallentina SM41 TaxID=1263870 RepID=M5U848_9BACT|nr:DUF1015 family protein [Rhodopirellula sallentina]EMI57620.1 hypothetical protein RSSM_00966 [Rhodopirellula sallentina SM41]
MAKAIPFAPLRYNLDHVSSLAEVVAPAECGACEDAINRLYKRHPANVVRVIANRSEPGDEANDRFERATEFIEQWVSEGVLRRDDSDAIYAFRQRIANGEPSDETFGWIVGLRIDDLLPADMPVGDVDDLRWIEATEVATVPVVAACTDADGSVFDAASAALRAGEDAAESAEIEIGDLGVIAHSQVRVDDPETVRAVCEAVRSGTIRLQTRQHPLAAAVKFRDHLAESVGELPEDHPANYVLAMLVGGKRGAAVAALSAEDAGEFEAEFGDRQSRQAEASGGIGGGLPGPVPLAGCIFYPVVAPFRFDANIASS